MSLKLVVLAVLLSAGPTTVASSGFLLGVDYSQPVGSGGAEGVTVDGQGAVYVLAKYDIAVQKYTPAGKLAWEASLGFVAIAIAADAAGNVYVLGTSSGTPSVSKLNADGTLATTLPLGIGLQPQFVSVSKDGRAWVAGLTVPGFTNPLQTTPNALQQTLPKVTWSYVFLARLNGTGTAMDYGTYFPGSEAAVLTGITVDGTGSLVIAGSTTSPDFPVTTGTTGPGPYTVFLACLKPDGSGLIYSVAVNSRYYPQPKSVAVDAAGNASVAYYDSGLTPVLAHFNPQGSLVFSKKGTGVGILIAMDPAGNTYSTGSALADFPVKNSVAQCGYGYLTVFSPEGELLQATWIPGAGAASLSADIAVGPDATVAVLGRAYSTLANVLTRFSPNAAVAPLQLVCLTDAAVYQVPGGPPPLHGYYPDPSLYYSNVPTGIAADEIVSLFGTGLGPQQGVQATVTVGSGFRARLEDVQVLFDGQPAPLLYVQGDQINAVVPWSLVAGTTTEVCVSYLGVQTNCLTEPVVQAAPAVFMTDGIHAAALNQDNTVNSSTNPALVGSVVSIFATGLGPVNPAVNDGSITGLPLPANVFPVTVDAVEGSYDARTGFVLVPFPVKYYGPAPLQVSGMSQVNFEPLHGAGTDGFEELLVFLHAANVSAPFRIYVSLTK